MDRLEKEIQTLREELGRKYFEKEDYKKVYKLSVKLDKLINKYYEKLEGAL